MNYAVILLNSTGGSGKGTFASIFMDMCMVEYISIVDLTKKIASQMGWGGDSCKSDKDRLFLSRLKDIHAEYNDSPFQYAKGKIDEFVSDCKDGDQEFNWVLFVDMREPNDIQRFKDEIECDNKYTVLIVNNRVADILTNHADAEVYDTAYDYIIENNGTIEDLEDSAKTFMKEVLYK